MHARTHHTALSAHAEDTSASAELQCGRRRRALHLVPSRDVKQAVAVRSISAQAYELRYRSWFLASVYAALHLGLDTLRRSGCDYSPRCVTFACALLDGTVCARVATTRQSETSA